MKPPGVDWKKVTFRNKTMKHQSGVTQINSADEWWYSHKNLYDNSGNLIGYAAVGYIAEVVKSADAPQIEIDMRDVYNEGSNSPYNPYGSSGSLFRSTSPGLPGCDDLYDVKDASPSTDAVERKTEHRGMVARIDLKGNMVWCKIVTIHGEGLQELVVQGGNIYIVGTHYGVKESWVLNGPRDFIPYNPTSTPSTNKFNQDIHSILDGEVGHMYVAKFNYDGLKKWEGLYGEAPFSNPGAAYSLYSQGRDIEFNSSNGHLYAVGRAKSSTDEGLFVAVIDSASGELQDHAILPHFTGQNIHTQNAFYEDGNSICQTHPTGTMAVGGLVEFSGNNSTDDYRGIVYSIKPDLTLNNGSGAWTTANPYVFPAATVTPQDQRGSGYQRASMIWEINYHTADNSILVALLDECIQCGTSGHNRARGKIYRINAQTGALASGFGDLGSINAYDLRIGVSETSDGGYVAVSSRQNTVDGYPSLSAMGSFSTCSWYQNIDNATNDPWAGDPDGWGVWDTDPVVRKFDASNALQWEWSEDVDPGRSRQLPPGDLKRQECMYKVTETPDKSIVISGNCSFNHDDNYMVKLFPDCNANVNYTHDYTAPFTPLTGTIAASRTVIGVMVIQNTVTISGNTTKIKFADSRLSGVPTYILIEPGGKLIVENGAELTSIDNAVCPQSMWEGIYVSGTSSLSQGANYNLVANQGFLAMNSATISNARDAITTGEFDSKGNFFWGKTGGVIFAENSDFINNQRDVQYVLYQNPSNPNFNLGQFIKCRFLTNSVLNEGSPMGHVSMFNVFNVRFRGCEFSYNAGSAYPQEKHGYGILSCDAVYKVEEYCNNAFCTNSQRTEFNNLTNGIQVLNGNPLRAVNVDHAVFSDAHQGTFSLPRHGIVLSNANNSQITRNEFSQSYLDYGVYINNSQNYAVSNNTLTGPGAASNAAGIVASESYGGSHRIYRNLIQDYSYGILTQYANSGYQNNVLGTMKADGLIMNCDRLYDNAVFDIWTTGDMAMGTAFYASIAQTQGWLTSNSPPSASNAKKLVRNWYTNSCTGFGKQWEADNMLKTIEHAAHADANTRPEGACGNSQLNIKNSQLTYSFTADCPQNELIIESGGCPCKNCCAHADISTALSAARVTYQDWKTTFEGEIDGGNTQDLLNLVVTQDPGVLAELLQHSPYLSDEVLLAYVSNTVYTATDLLQVHDANKPITAQVWDALTERGFSAAVMEDFEEQQAELPASQRSVLENDYARARADLQFITSAKLNYFLLDTLETARDSALAVITENLHLLDFAVKLAPRAYAGAGHWERAFEFADSLSGITGFEEAMEIEIALMELDSSHKGAYKILDNPTLQGIVNTVGADSTLPGFWQARAVLHQVYGADMRLRYFHADIGEERLASNGEVEKTDKKSQPEGLVKAADFDIFPNPASEEVIIRYTIEPSANHTVVIMDALGRIVLKSPWHSSGLVTLTTSGLQNGVYFINLVENDRVSGSKKLIIQK